jgi:hypothetical protein
VKHKAKPSGSSGGSRLRFAILAATVAAFLLVPAAAQASEGVEPLTVTLKGTGAGKAFIAEGGSQYRGSPEINCAYASPGPQTGVCKTKMSDEGEGWEQVFVTVKADPGSEFVGWTVKNTEFEGCIGTFATCAPFVEPPGTGSGEAEIIATFNLEPPKFLLTVAKEGGNGTVASSPAGIECGATCSAKFEEGKTVTLTASPASGYAFSSWSGCTEHVGLTCKVLMSAAKTVKANFFATPSLSIEKAGSGQGKVTASGISCDENCPKASSAVKAGTLVTVKATPAKGSEAAIFESGTGNASACSSSCIFTISENSSVKVKFDAKPTSKLTVNLTGPGAYKGKVTGKGALKGLTGSAINCPSGCTTQTESFFSADEVTLTAAPSTGYTFNGWSLPAGSNAGTCTGKTSPCIVPTSSAKTLAAEFK